MLDSDGTVVFGALRGTGLCLMNFARTKNWKIPPPAVWKPWPTLLNYDPVHPNLPVLIIHPKNLITHEACDALTSFLKTNKIHNLNVVCLTDDKELEEEIGDFFQHILFDFIPVIDEFSESEESYWETETESSSEEWPAAPEGAVSYWGELSVDLLRLIVHYEIENIFSCFFVNKTWHEFLLCERGIWSHLILATFGKKISLNGQKNISTRNQMAIYTNLRVLYSQLVHVRELKQEAVRKKQMRGNLYRYGWHRPRRYKWQASRHPG